MKRVLSLLLVAAMLLAIPVMPVMPVTAQAATTEANVTDPTSNCPCCGVPMDQLTWLPWDDSVSGMPAAGHYYLAGDYNQGSVKTIMAGDDVVLDLRGYTWSSHKAQQHISLSYHRMLSIQGNFYLMDTVGGGLVETELRPNYGGAFHLYYNEWGEPTFHMLSGTIRPRIGDVGYKPGGLAYVTAGCVFKMTGGCITGYQAKYHADYSNGVTDINGGAILATANSEVLIHGGTIMNCSASTNGGAIYSSGTVELKNCTLTGNTAGKWGGNVAMVGGTLTVEKALIENGSANCQGTTENGGGNVYGMLNAVINVTDSVIRNGYAANHGGNIYTSTCTLTLKDTEVTAGAAQRSGGNIRAYKTTNTFDSLTSNGDIVVQAGTLTLKNDTKIGLNSTGLLLHTNPAVTASALSGEAEIYVHTNAATTVAAVGANINYFKPAYRTVLEGGDAAAIMASQAADGTEGGYCPHCNGKKATWTAFTGQTASGHYYLSGARQAAFTVPETADIVIDLNGKTWSVAADRAIVNRGSLAVVDSGTLSTYSSGWTGGTITGVGVNGYNAGVLHNNGTFKLYGGTLRYVKDNARVVNKGGVVYNLENTSKMYMYGGVLDGSAYNTTTGSDSGLGGAFYQRFGSELTMTAGRMIGGTAYAGGTATFEQNVTVNITGGSFSGGKATSTIADYSGGNLFFGGNAATGSVQVSNASITGGTAAVCGGNIYLGKYNTNVFDNCYIAGGKATDSGSYGGNVVAYKASNAEMKNTTLLSGSAYKGGNFYIASSGAAPKLTDCLITCGYTTKTAAGSSGGNLFFNNGNPIVQGGEISHGKAGGQGGNVYIYTGVYVAGNKTTFQANNGEVPCILGGKATDGGNIAVAGVLILTDACIASGKLNTNETTGAVLGMGKDIYLTGAKASLTVGSGVTGNISMYPNNEFDLPTYGDEIPSTASTGISPDLNLMLEHLEDAPKAVHSGNTLCVAEMATVDADGNQVWHKDAAAAVAASDENSYIKLYANTALTLTKNTYVDLNGKTVTITDGEEYLLGMDSTGDGYGLPTGRVTVQEGTVKEKSIVYAPNGNKYVALKETDGKLSFHRLGMDLTTVTINLTKSGILFRGTFGADSTLKEKITEYGIAVKLDEMPTADFAGAHVTRSLGENIGDGTTQEDSVLVYNILRDNLTSDENKKRGEEKEVCAAAYVKLDGGIVYLNDEGGEQWSLKDAFKKVETLVEEQPETFRRYTNVMRAFYAKWMNKGIENWAAKDSKFLPVEADDGVIDILMIGSSFCSYYVEELSLIAQAANVPIRVCNVYSSGCPLSKYWIDWNNGAAAYQFYSTVNGERSGTSGSKSLEWCLGKGEWDVITMQEYSGNIRNYEVVDHLANTDTYTDDLFSYITSQFPKAKFYFHQTWAFEKGYDRDAGYLVQTDADQALAAWKQQQFALGLLTKYGDPATSGIAGKEFQCMDGRIPTGEAWQLVREGWDPDGAGDIYNPYDKLCVRTGTPDNAGDHYHDGDLGGGQYLNALVWFFQIMKDQGKDYTVSDITWQPDDTTYGYALADGLDFDQLKDCAYEAVYGSGWTYDEAKYTQTTE